MSDLHVVIIFFVYASVFRTQVSRRPSCLTWSVRFTLPQTAVQWTCRHMNCVVTWSMWSLTSPASMGKPMDTQQTIVSTANQGNYSNVCNVTKLKTLLQLHQKYCSWLPKCQKNGINEKMEVFQELISIACISYWSSVPCWKQKMKTKKCCYKQHILCHIPVYQLKVIQPRWRLLLHVKKKQYDTLLHQLMVMLYIVLCFRDVGQLVIPTSNYSIGKRAALQI